MRDRMAEKKRRRMKKLEKKQEKEKTEAVRSILIFDFMFLKNQDKVILPV